MQFLLGTLTATFGVVLFASTFGRTMPESMIPLWLRASENAVPIMRVMTRCIGVWLLLIGAVLIIHGLINHGA